jgi:hypothetical protein
MDVKASGHVLSLGTIPLTGATEENHEGTSVRIEGVRENIQIGELQVFSSFAMPGNSMRRNTV